MFEFMSLLNYKFDISHRGLNVKLHTSGGAFDDKIIDFDPVSNFW